MARRSAAQRAAFRKMIAARKRQLRGNPKRRRRRRPKAVVVLTNPRRRRRRAHRHNAARSVRRRRRNAAILANPRMRHRRRRRNPGGSMVMEFVKDYFKAGIPAVLAGASMGLLDSQLLASSSAIIRVGAKVVASALVGGVFRRHPLLAGAAMGGILGTFGYEQAVSLSGGQVAPTATTSVKGIAALIREDPKAMGILLREMRGMGLSVDNTVSLGQLSSYQGSDTNYANVNLG